MGSTHSRQAQRFIRAPHVELGIKENLFVHTVYSFPK